MGQKYLVVSDNHGNMSNLEYVIERFRGKIEALIHCGDSAGNVRGIGRMSGLYGRRQL